MSHREKYGRILVSTHLWRQRLSFSGNSDEYTQRAPQHLRLTKELRSTSGVSLAQEHLRTTIASVFETVGARPFLRAVEDFGDGTELLVGTNVHVVARA